MFKPFQSYAARIKTLQQEAIALNTEIERETATMAARMVELTEAQNELHRVIGGSH